MRSIKFKLPMLVAGGLLTVTATAAEPTVPSRIDPGLYNSFAQAGVPSGIAPVVPDVPVEDRYQMRALPPSEAAAEAEEGPTRYLENEFLGSRGIQTYGWINAGIGANAWGAPWNGPVTFNDRAWQGMLNQLYLVNERVVDTADGGWDLGGRVDLLYGTDYFYTVAGGLDAYRDGSGPRWDSSKYYGLAMPQLYAELGVGDHAVKFGHFYTIIGYEVVPAVGNFFYTHAYTMQYGEPFTHTGILDTWSPNDQLTVYAGITNGWDNWDVGMAPVVNPGYPGLNSNAALLAGVTFTNSDETQALTWAITSGNENTGIFGDTYVGNRSMYSIVYTNELTERLTYVFQNDMGWQFNGTEEATGPGTARWYGINQYVFYNFTDTLIGGLRFEWFRDNDGTRVVSGLRNATFGSEDYADGFAGNFWAMTWGLNWLPTTNIVVRPELRYDWYDGARGTRGDLSPGALPYGRDFTRSGQFYGGCDVIWQF